MRYFVLFCVCWGLLSACGGGSSDQTQALAFDPFVDQYDAHAYNVGVFPLYPYRRDSDLLAVEQINASGGVLGKRLNIVSVSFQVPDAFETIDIQDTARRMIEDYDMQLLSTGSSFVTLKLAEITVPRDKVLLLDSATSPTISTLEDNDLVYRMPPSDAFAGQVLANLAWETGAQQCSTVFVSGDSYGESLSAEFKQAFEQLGGRIGAEIALPQDQTTGFAAFFPQLYQVGTDCVLPALLRSTTAANLINESGGVGFQGAYFFSDAAFAEGFIASIANPDQLQNSLAVTSGFGLRNSSEYLYFADLYRSHFGNEPRNYAAHAFDLVMVAALAIERAGREHNTDNPTGLMLRDSLRAVMNPPGTAIGPSQIARGLELLRQGEEVDFHGATNASMAWDANGDVAGEIVYDVYKYSSAEQDMIPERQVVIERDF